MPGTGPGMTLLEASPDTLPVIIRELAVAESKRLRFTPAAARRTILEDDAGARSGSALPGMRSECNRETDCSV